MSNRALVYRCPPNSEHKAAQELRQAGIRAGVPRNRAGKRNPFTKMPPATAPGYVFAKGALSVAYAKHVRGAPIGDAPVSAVLRLYLDRMKPKAARPFLVGDQIEITEGPCKGAHATIVEVRGRGTGKTVLIGDGRVSVHIRNCKHIDPG